MSRLPSVHCSGWKYTRGWKVYDKEFRNTDEIGSWVKSKVLVIN